MASREHLFLRNVISTFTTDLASVGLNLVAGVLVARLLAPQERGLLALVMLLPVTLAYFADLGISQAIVYLLGRKKRSPQAVAGVALSLALVVGAGLALVLWLGGGWVIPTFLSQAPPAYYALALALLPLLLFDNYLLSLLRAQQHFAPFNLRRLLAPVFLLAGVLVLVWLAGLGLNGAVLAFALSALLSLGLSVLLVFRWVPLGLRFRSLRFDRHIAGEALGFGLKSYLQNLVGHLHYRLDVYILALFLPPAEVAFYVIATSLAEVVFYLPDAVGTVLFPKLSSEPEARIHLLTAEVTRHTLAVTALAALGLLAAGTWLIPTVYGPAYRPAVAPFLVILPGVLAMTVYKVLTRNFTSRDRQQVSILAASLSLILNLVLNFLLIPRFGVVGAALASLLSYTASAVLLLLVFRHESKLPMRWILILHPGDLSRYVVAWQAGRRGVYLLAKTGLARFNRQSSPRLEPVKPAEHRKFPTGE